MWLIGIQIFKNSCDLDLCLGKCVLPSMKLWLSKALLDITIGPRQANLVLIAYASSEGSGEPAHPRSLARTFAARSYKQWVKRNLQTESQIPSPSEWLGMRSWNLSWRNARRHKFAWRGSIKHSSLYGSLLCVELTYEMHVYMLIAFFNSWFRRWCYCACNDRVYFLEI